MRIPLLEPMLAMVGVTASVWTYMYIKRLGYMQQHQINPQDVCTPELMLKHLPQQVHYPAHNLRNLFELPVIFYAICLTAQTINLYSTNLYMLAWVYVLLRAIHSLIHCTYNKVTHRFTVYLLSSLVLWLMVVILALQHILR